MSNDPFGLMEKLTDDFCKAWGDLIFSKDRGEVYTLFNRKQKELIEHLRNCERCEKFLLRIEPMPTAMENMDYLELLAPKEFADLIRKVFANAQKMSLKDDHEDRGADPIC